jgi:hypothetical protein
MGDRWCDTCSCWTGQVDLYWNRTPCHVYITGVGLRNLYLWQDTILCKVYEYNYKTDELCVAITNWLLISFWVCFGLILLGFHPDFFLQNNYVLPQKVSQLVSLAQPQCEIEQCQFFRGLEAEKWFPPWGGIVSPGTPRCSWESHEVVV